VMTHSSSCGFQRSSDIAIVIGRWGPRLALRVSRRWPRIEDEVATVVALRALDDQGTERIVLGGRAAHRLAC